MGFCSEEEDDVSSDKISCIQVLTDWKKNVLLKRKNNMHKFYMCLYMNDPLNPA